MGPFPKKSFPLLLIMVNMGSTFIGFAGSGCVLVWREKIGAELAPSDPGSGRAMGPDTSWHPPQVSKVSLGPVSLRFGISLVPRVCETR